MIVRLAVGVAIVGSGFVAVTLAGAVLVELAGRVCACRASDTPISNEANRYFLIRIRSVTATERVWLVVYVVTISVIELDNLTIEPTIVIRLVVAV